MITNKVYFENFIINEVTSPVFYSKFRDIYLVTLL